MHLTLTARLFDHNGDSRQQNQSYRETWAIRAEGSDEWQTLSDDQLTVPWTDDRATYEVRLRLYAFDDYQVAEASTSLRVENRAAFRLLSPSEHHRLRPGQRVRLHYQAQDAAGDDEVAVSWYQSRDGQTWQPATLENGTWWRLPAGTGLVYLKAVYQIAPGRTRDSVYRWTLR